MWTNVLEFQMIELSSKKKELTCASEASRKFLENLHFLNQV